MSLYAYCVIASTRLAGDNTILSWQSLKDGFEARSRWGPLALRLEHSQKGADIGKVISTWPDEARKLVCGMLRIDDPDVAKRVMDGSLTGCSIGAGGSVKNYGAFFLGGDIRPAEISLGTTPSDPLCRVQSWWDEASGRRSQQAPRPLSKLGSQVVPTWQGLEFASRPRSAGQAQPVRKVQARRGTPVSHAEVVALQKASQFRTLVQGAGQVVSLLEDGKVAKAAVLARSLRIWGRRSI